MLSVFASNISALRKEKKFSQRKVATLLGISQALLSHYENGHREPGLEFVVNIASLYEVSCDFLLGCSQKKQAGEQDLDALAQQLIAVANKLSPSSR